VRQAADENILRRMRFACWISKVTRWFKYDRDWFVCKQAALRSSYATL